MPEIHFLKVCQPRRLSDRLSFSGSLSTTRSVTLRLLADAGCKTESVWKITEPTQTTSTYSVFPNYFEPTNAQISSPPVLFGLFGASKCIFYENLVRRKLLLQREKLFLLIQKDGQKAVWSSVKQLNVAGLFFAFFVCWSEGSAARPPGWKSHRRLMFQES